MKTTVIGLQLKLKRLKPLDCELCRESQSVSVISYDYDKYSFHYLV